MKFSNFIDKFDTTKNSKLARISNFEIHVQKPYRSQYVMDFKKGLKI